MEDVQKEILEVAAICLYLFHGGLWFFVANLVHIQGEHNPLPLMSKGDNEVEALRLPSSPKGEIVGIMAKVLSLMATHSGDRSQYFKSAAEIDDQLSNIEENKGYAGTPYIRCVHAGQCYIKCVHTRSYPVQEVRTPSAHISRQRNSHVGFSYVLLLVFSRRYCIIMVSARGIDP